MATLTYDPSEAKEGEFTEEEQESIKVGEALEEQQQQLLAGKFKDAEDLENAYIELQKKLGDPSRDEPEAEADTTEPEEEVEEEEKEVEVELLDRLWEESQKDEISEETLKELSDMDPKDVAKLYLKYRADNTQTVMTEEDTNTLHSVVGGPEEYKNMMSWAAENLSENEIQMYDTVMDKGDPLAAYFAVQALAYRFNDSRGVDGQMLQGKAVSEKGDVFKSQAQVVEAMTDPRYDKDPAYRQELYNKLERSNLQF